MRALPIEVLELISVKPPLIDPKKSIDDMTPGERIILCSDENIFEDWRKARIKYLQQLQEEDARVHDHILNSETPVCKLCARGSES